MTHVDPVCGMPVDFPSRRVAYLSMEVALSNDMPTYSGGLGVLAGDTLRSCADLEVPVVGISLVHRRGYFRQEICDGWQYEHDASWVPQRLTQESTALPPSSSLISGRCETGPCSRRTRPSPRVTTSSIRRWCRECLESSSPRGARHAGRS